MRRRSSVPLAPPSVERICCFCGLKDDNELDYGKFHEYNGIITHYYCLLLSSNMQQQGRDDEGILGFLPEDINKELRRGRKLTCCYCKKIGATLGCCNTKCKKIFHFPCGLKSGSLHQFFGEFRSYCKNHRPRQKIDDRIVKEVESRESMICYICYDDVDCHDMVGTLWAPCCKKNAWFHRTCVQQLAMSAGYFFKCPLCNNKLEFQRAMLDHGIFIPSQDASWELVPNAFQELLYSHNRCDAEKCLCPKGRSYTSTNAKWELTLCSTCGSQGIHMACGNLKWLKPVWECPECTSILNKSVIAGRLCPESLRATVNSRGIRRERADLSEDESSNDSDISVGGPTEIPSPVTTSNESLSQPNGQKMVTMVNGNSCESINAGECSPLTKKPRISEEHEVEKDSVDSDDDIIVLSGPSNSSIRQVNGNSTNINVDRTIKISTNSNDRQIGSKTIDPREIDIVEKVYREVAKFSGEKMRANNFGIVKNENRVPLEIDLSDSDSVSIDNPITHAESSVPELNLVISNVTSLAPEVFANVPDVNDQMEQTLNNDSSTPNTHDELKIVRFDETRLSADNSSAIPVYGLTIPGTNSTVPLIITTEQIDPNSQMLQDIWNKGILKNNSTGNCNEPIPIKCRPGPKSRKAEIARMASLKQQITIASSNTNSVTSAQGNVLNQCNGETPSNLQSLSYSVPLGAILNEKIVLPRANGKKVKKSSVDNETTTKTATTAMTGIREWSKDKNVLVKSDPGSRNTESENLSSVEKTPISTVNTSENNGFSMNPVSQIYGFVLEDPSTVNEMPNVQSKIPPITSANVPSVSTSIRPENSSQIILPAPSQIVSSDQMHMVPTDETQIVLPGQRPILPKIDLSQNGQFIDVKNYPYVPSKVNDATTNSNGIWQNVHGSLAGVNQSLTHANKNVTNYDGVMNFPTKQISGLDIIPYIEMIPTDQNDQCSTENCDGDAGTGPAVQPTPLVATDAKSPRNATSFTQLAATNGNCERTNADETFDSRQEKSRSTAHDNGDDTIECTIAAGRGNAHNRTGLMDKTINLRDLKFTVFGPGIVKMTIYETYCVNMKIASDSKYSQWERRCASRRKSVDSFVRRTSRSSRNSDNDGARHVDNDFEDLPDNDKNCTNVENIENGMLGETECNSRSNGTTEESEIPFSETSQNNVNSRIQDELKENRDPVPSSTSLLEKCASPNDRKSKTRLRSGVSGNTMQLSNERDNEEIIDNERDKNSHKYHVANDSKFFYNGLKDKNVCRPNETSLISRIEETPSPIVSPNRVNDCENGEISDNHESPVKRPKYVEVGNSRESDNCENIMKHLNTVDDNSMTINHRLVKKTERSKSRRSTREYLSEKSLIMKNILDERRHDRRRKTRSEGSMCCKVSIDLRRIQSILAKKLGVMNTSVNDEICKRTRSSSCDNKSEKSNLSWNSHEFAGTRKSHSLDDLISRESSAVKFSYERKCKSLDNLCVITEKKKRVDSINSFVTIKAVGNESRDCKEKTRNFEKHDCVR